MSEGGDAKIYPALVTHWASADLNKVTAFSKSSFPSPCYNVCTLLAAFLGQG